MWYLKSETDPRVLYVSPNKEITVGRSVDSQVCNFAIPDDASISRKHATLKIINNVLSVQDLESRYGTFINDFTAKIENSVLQLNNNDVVRFGKMGSVWKVHEAKFVTCTSTLKGESLQKLKMSLGQLGALLKNEWDDTCEYLTMPAITLTIKVVLALAQGAHIVTSEYWNKCLEAVNSQRTLPDPQNFTPQVVESTLNKEKVSFLPNAKRSKLFVGKTVIFFSRRQLDMYKPVLMKCSATALLLSETKMTKAMLCDDNMIVIQYNITNANQETQAQQNQINDIVSYMKTKGKRVVADAEIGLAILYCSTIKYCNPTFNFSSEVIKQKPDPSVKPGNVLAQETQEPSNMEYKENVVINDSLSSSIDKGASSKRKLSSENDDIEMNANKKMATNVTHTNSTNNESAKRKFTEDSNETQNPTKKMAIDNEGDDIFNFLSNNEKENQNKETEKKLNFAKPLKRKLDTEAKDDELFNFVQDKAKADGDASKSSLFDADNIKKEWDTDDCQDDRNNLKKTETDIAALRGSKLKELMESNANLVSGINNNVTVKKEEPDELDRKMSYLDLGETIIKIRSDLIVKKEPIEIDAPVNQVQNYKKFKKVWPVKMQVTVIPKASMTIVIPDTSDTDMNSLSY